MNTRARRLAHRRQVIANRRTALGTIALGVTAIVVGWNLGAPLEVETTSPPARPWLDSGHVDEDSPPWDCSTMGNRECGPGVIPYVIDGGGIRHNTCHVTVEWVTCTDGWTTPNTWPDGTPVAG